MFEIIPASFYRIFFNCLITILVMIWILSHHKESNDLFIRHNPSSKDRLSALVICVFLILFFGFRNPFSPYFADTRNYTSGYNYFLFYGGDFNLSDINFQSKGGEIGWTLLLRYMAANHFSVNLWYTIIATIYVGGIFYAVSKFFPNNVYIAFLFAVLNFGFFSGAVNGIRNWSALSLVLISLYYISKKEINWPLILIIIIFAFSFHKSIILPVACMITSVYFIKRPKTAIIIWFLSITISFIAGDVLTDLFKGIGFDDRMDEYIIKGQDAEVVAHTFSHSGFRWDFLLFSSAPILWGIFLMKRFQLNNRVYNIIFNTYVLANSFWVMVIRAAFSNRFAALSWFMYFLVISYPLLKFKLFPNQTHQVSIALVFLLLISIII